MHIHTTFSPDGKSSMEEQCIKAIEIGIPIICFTDHVDFNSSEINVGRIINKLWHFYAPISPLMFSRPFHTPKRV